MRHPRIFLWAQDNASCLREAEQRCPGCRTWYPVAIEIVRSALFREQNSLWTGCPRCGRKNPVLWPGHVDGLEAREGVQRYRFSLTPPSPPSGRTRRSPSAAPSVRRRGPMPLFRTRHVAAFRVQQYLGPKAFVMGRLLGGRYHVTLFGERGERLLALQAKSEPDAWQLLARKLPGVAP